MDINLPIDPPVNNNIQTNVYDKLDQVAFEKTRVANSQLDSRLSIQERIINKYRKDVERVHSHQMQRLRREAKKIREKRPDYVYDDSDTSTSRSRAAADLGRKRCLSEPPSNLSYCRRYYSHHFNLRDDTKTDKDDKASQQKGGNDYCNIALRLYFFNMMNTGKNHISSDLEPLDNEDLGKSLDSALPVLPSYDSPKCQRSQSLNAQSSVDESDHDDIFAASHNTFKSTLDTLKQKGSVDRLSELKETVTVTSSTEDPEKDLRKKRNNKHKRRRSRATDVDIAKYNTGLTKTKHAFEKLFAGLL